MKSAVLLLIFAVSYIECRKVVPPIDKNANLAFINMEGGGGVKPAQPTPKPVIPAPSKPAAPTPAPAKASIPVSPIPVPKPAAPVPVPTKPSVPAQPVQPTQPSQIKPRPVNPAPAANPITTPGPGSVKQLINFYDSQGKASPIRPYSYSQAVKQG